MPLLMRPLPDDAGTDSQKSSLHGLLYSKCTRALTFENLCQPIQSAAPHSSAHQCQVSERHWHKFSKKLGIQCLLIVHTRGLTFPESPPAAGPDLCLYICLYLRLCLRCRRDTTTGLQCDAATYLCCCACDAVDRTAHAVAGG